MATNFLLDLGALREVKKELHQLADQIGPKLEGSAFDSFVSDWFDLPGDGAPGVDDTLFGNNDLAFAVRGFKYDAKPALEKGEKSLRELGDLFERVADSVEQFDANAAEGIVNQTAQMQLGTWKSNLAAWNYRQANIDKCTPDEDGYVPSFCSAKDPGPPPVDHTFTTPTGSVKTHFTLNDAHEVIKEETTVVIGGHTYVSTNSYEEGGRRIINDATAPDGTRTHTVTTLGANGSSVIESTDVKTNKTTTTVIDIQPDGSGTKTVTEPGPDGKVTTYTRPNRDTRWIEKVKTEAEKEEELRGQLPEMMGFAGP